MALVIFSLSCIILCIISIPCSWSDKKNFQFLDVSSSLQHAREVVSPDFSHTSATTIHQPHSLSLTLFPRSSLPSSDPTLNNYTSLTLSRLARDEAHVLSLSTNSNLEAPLISGLNYQSGEYFARIGIGRPAAQLYMIADTGSDVTWLQCRPCQHCYPQSDPIFNPAASSTYATITCLSPQCRALDTPACLGGLCLYEVLYGDLSYTIGNFATETITFGSSTAVPGVAIGCGHNNGGLFSGAAGLVGLGAGPLSLPSQIQATSFSYCLVNRDSNSSSTLDFNSTQPADSVVAPLLVKKASNFRYVGLSGISVGGEAVNFPPSLLEMGSDGSGGVIVDSGTTVSRLRREVYVPVRDAFRKMTVNLSDGGAFLLFDTCYKLHSLSEARVPTVSFLFSGGGRLDLRPNNYMIPVDSEEGIFCFAFAPTMGRMSIIGNVQQQGMRVTYDLANRHIAFSPDKC